jgi:hypothetical protein
MFKIARFGLAFGTGAKTIARMLALGLIQLYAVLVSYVPPHSLKRIAYSFASFHIIGMVMCC